MRNQVEQIESSGGTEGVSLRGMSVIIVTSRGARTGKIRKNPVMRVEHDGRYAAVASIGGAPKNPVWYYNLIADPHVEVQDGPVKQDMVARELSRRREGAVVGARGRGVPGLRGLPDPDRASDPGVRPGTHRRVSRRR